MHAPDSTLIIGSGRVGSTLARALVSRGWPVAAITARRLAPCRDLAASLGDQIVVASMDELPGPYPVVVLAVVDAAIREVTGKLVTQGLVDDRSVVLHLSGAASSEVLEAAAASGAATGSMHPLQTFPDPESGLRALPGSHWFLEGAPAALEVAQRIVSLLQGTAHTIATSNKALYHASASIACNLLTALLDAALDTAQAAGLRREDMLEALYPLARSALDNARDSGTHASLTGPVSRGDVDVVALHLEVLENLDELQALYRILGRRSVSMAREADRIDDATVKRLLDCLADPR